jgi:hypothetical protein
MDLRSAGQHQAEGRQELATAPGIELAALDQVGDDVGLDGGRLQMTLDLLDQRTKEQPALVPEQLGRVAPGSVQRDREHAPDCEEHQGADAEAEIGGDREPPEPSGCG